MSDDIGGRYTLSDREFNHLSSFIDKELGIKMPPTKKVMLESRLQKRLKALKITDFTEYYEYLISPEGRSKELVSFFNCVTTNKTDFFRENSHFEYLSQDYLTGIYKKGVRQVNVWSCACSSGEEPYTLAIVLEEFRLQFPDFNYRIYASDISTKVLDAASSAVYGEEDVRIIPMEMRRRYFLRGKGEKKYLYKIKKEIRQKVSFFRLNLMDENYRLPEAFDFVFCRNVLIYFERERQKDIINKICRNIDSEGLLFLGHSESMAGMSLHLKSVTTAVYRKV